MQFNINKIFYFPQAEVPEWGSPEPVEEFESTINRLLKYVMTTPGNVNPAIILQLVRDLDLDELEDFKEGSKFSNEPTEPSSPISDGHQIKE